MPGPDPQPPQPHPISAARWLLMLVPSALVIILPALLSVIGNLLGSDVLMPAIAMVAIIGVALGVVLCFEYGDRLEKWLHGEIRNRSRALGYGFLILIVNAIIAFAGCAALAAFP
jgi:hypothetical protein